MPRTAFHARWIGRSAGDDNTQVSEKLIMGGSAAPTLASPDGAADPPIAPQVASEEDDEPHSG